MKSSKATIRQKIICFIGLFTSHFVTDLWNVIDISLILSGTAAVLLGFKHGYGTVPSICFFALTAVCLWFKALYFLRPHRTAGLFGKLIFTYLD
jgi:hypothetical protein